MRKLSSGKCSGIKRPFRAAVDCELNGDRKGYQLDYANGRQALLEGKESQSFLTFERAS
jgi:delta-aminolevulinic acid dehydratase/porphobilinogen synthase